MELDSEDILNEVDELLSKLDKLPDDVRLQALKKLSQKVSAPRLRGGRGGRGRGRGAWRRPASPLCTDTKVQTVNIKKESVEEFTETDTDHSGTQTEINEAKLRRIEDEAQEKFLGIEQQAGEEAAVVKEVKAKTGKKKKGKTSPDNIIVSGRRHTKKVNYRQLAEYGHGNESQEEEETTQADIKPQAVLPQVKRGRGRPRKYLPVVPTTTTAMQCSSGTQMGDKCTTYENDDKENPGMSEEQGNELDLLESCLKESGIKAGDADRGGKKTNEQQEKVGENEAKASVHVTEEEEEEDDPKTEVQNVYVCDTVEAVDKVLKKKSIKSQYKCDECGKMYSTMSILKTHQIRHRNKADLPFKCNECDFSAASKIELFRHAYKHTDIQLYICEICGNTFSRDTSLREHIEYVHAKTRILKCAQCNFVTYRRSCMRNHVLTHEGTRPVIACPVCGVTFRSKRNLRAHLFSHAGAKPFACEECGKKFIMRNRLAAHKLQVHGPRTHKCSHCIKHFPTIHHLRRHIRIHTGEKPYKCCFCAFSCNTQGNLIKHIRQVHDKINFTYKDFLKESGEEHLDAQVEDEDLEKMNKEGRELAQRLLPTLGEWTGQTLTVDQLREQVQQEKDSKAAAIQEQQTRKKRRVLRKSSNNVKSSTYYSETSRKITLYTLAGGNEDSTTIDTPMDDQISVEPGPLSLGDSQYLLTHTDDNGCVMIIPWGVSLIGESEEGEEEGEWTQPDLQGDKIVKSSSASDGVVTIKVPKGDIDIPRIVQDNSISNLESALELSTTIKTENSIGDIHVSDGIIEVGNLSDVVGDLDPADMKESTRPDMDTNMLSDKNFCKQLPESIQVIASNEPVDETVPNASNFVLPEGYIVDDDGQVIQLTDNVIDANLLLRQMGQVVRGTDAPEVTINKITSNVYSLMSQGSDGQEGETFVITTQEGEEEEEETVSTHSSGEEDQKSSLVLIVNADDIENS